MVARALWSIYRFSVHPWTRYVAAWLALLGATVWLHHFALHSFDNNRKSDTSMHRPGGNDGHTTIDFAGQWLMGRMLTRGYGRELYDRNRQYQVALSAFPRELEPRDAINHDADNLVWLWFMDCDRLDPRKWYEFDSAVRGKASLAAPLMANQPLQAAVLVAFCQQKCWTVEKLDQLRQKRLGGPLYPPIHAFLFAPLALDDNPQWAYACVQWLVLGLAYVAGLGIRFLTRGRIWWPVATGAIIFFCGFEGAHHLGQNGPLSLAILVWGWVLVARGWETAGGAVWGLLAFKPIWAAAFLLVPLLTGRRRMAGGMIAVGATLALATLPFVGIEPWLDWLKIGRTANVIYDVDAAWVGLSRDVLCIPRRFLVNFDDPYYERDRWYIQLAGWGLWAVLLESTVRLTLLCRRETRAITGPAAAFVLLGAWLACFHFMYYDVLLAGLGFAVLFADPGKFVQPLLLVVNPPEGFRLTQAWRDYFRPRLATTHPDLPSYSDANDGAIAGRPPTILVANSFLLYALVALLVIQNAFTFWGIAATVQARIVPPAPVSGPGGDVIGTDGKPSMKTPRLEVTTHQDGPPWETYCLIGIWLWAGMAMVHGKLQAAPTGRLAPGAAPRQSN